MDKQISTVSGDNPPGEEAQIHAEFFGHEHITVIEPHGSLFDLRLREIWAYRDLIGLFVRRDFVAQYKQTILGPAWHFIQPLFTTIIFTIVFGKIAKLPTDGVPPFLFYMAGTVIWSYFAMVMTETSGTFIRNANIFGKVYFPRLVMPIATLLSKMIAFALQFFFFLCFLLWFWWRGADVHFTPWVFATPLLLLMMAAYGLGLGILVSAMTTRYRDLNVLVTFGIQLYMYLSPIIYPVSALSEPWRTFSALNPITPIVEVFRYAYLGSGTVSIPMLGLSFSMILVVLIGGIMLFNKVERTFMDTV